MDITIIMILSICLVMASFSAWFMSGFSQGYSKTARNVGIVTLGLATIGILWCILTWNTKDCSEYLIDDYQSGEVPVSCVGTYNTVPKNTGSKFD